MLEHTVDLAPSVAKSCRTFPRVLDKKALVQPRRNISGLRLVLQAPALRKLRFDSLHVCGARLVQKSLVTSAVGDSFEFANFERTSDLDRQYLAATPRLA